ncbi:Zinc finger protein ZAT5 [Platanthera guangdongensis]|uniref:Zinc finger protein ZAT5 n=1 Tax=Platanthera guangdongensis TaxID=2320717 RepID=A0ABR2LSH9_9ASPA
MEGQEDAVFSTYSSGSTDHAAGHLPSLAAKRSRTRRRHRSAGHPGSANTASSSASSTEESAFTDDDQGMANCLILLAQGGRGGGGGGGATSDAGKLTTSGGRAPPGLFVYECKTCNKSFQSFQALGGHRASHKKLKMAAEAAAAAADVREHLRNISVMNSLLKRADAAGKLAGRVHECSICGSEFSSGQALGGHMRRHRPAVEVLPEELKKEKNVVLALDLNLPAPAEDDGSFTLPGKPLVFSPASALVDCHY